MTQNQQRRRDRRAYRELQATNAQINRLENELTAFAYAAQTLAANPMHQDSVDVMEKGNDPRETCKALREAHSRAGELRKVLRNAEDPFRPRATP